MMNIGMLFLITYFFRRKQGLRGAEQKSLKGHIQPTGRSLGSLA